MDKKIRQRTVKPSKFTGKVTRAQVRKAVRAVKEETERAVVPVPVTPPDGEC